MVKKIVRRGALLLAIFLLFVGADSAFAGTVRVQTLGSVTFHLLDKHGEPISFGSVRWYTETARAAVRKPANALGVVSFDYVPFGHVATVCVRDGQLANGILINFCQSVGLASGDNDVQATNYPDPVSATFKVEFPNGDPVPGVKVHGYAPMHLQTDGAMNGCDGGYDPNPTNVLLRFSTVPSFCNSWGFVQSVPEKYMSQTQLTNAEGLVTFTGLDMQSFHATYTDAFLQQDTPYISRPSTSETNFLHFDYMPIIELTSDDLSASKNASVDVDVAIGDPDPASTASMHTQSIHTMSMLSNKTVKITPPSGASQTACKAASKLTAKTGSNGHAKLKICASATGNYRVSAVGAVGAKNIFVRVRGASPTAPTDLSTACQIPGHATVTWNAPRYDGARAVKSYTVTATSSGKPTVTRVIRSGTAFTTRTVDLTLAGNRRWTIAVKATTIKGTSAAVSSTVIVK